MKLQSPQVLTAKAVAIHFYIVTCWPFSQFLCVCVRVCVCVCFHYVSFIKNEMKWRPFEKKFMKPPQLEKELLILRSEYD